MENKELNEMSFAPLLKKILEEMEVEQPYRHAVKKMLIDKFVEAGYLRKDENRVLIGPNASDIGMHEEDNSRDGRAFKTVMYGAEAQELIISLLPELIAKAKDENMVTVREAQRQEWVKQKEELKSVSDSQRYERVNAVFAGEEISFKRCWSNHYFKDDELEALLKGESIEIMYIDRNGKARKTTGMLKKKSGSNGMYWGFSPDFDID